MVSSDLLVNWAAVFLGQACKLRLFCSSFVGIYSKPNDVQGTSALIKTESVTCNFVRRYKTNWSSLDMCVWGGGGSMRRFTLQRETSKLLLEELSFLVLGSKKLLMRSLENRLHNGTTHVDCPKPLEK